MKHSLSTKLILVVSVIIFIALGALYLFLLGSLSDLRQSRAAFAVGIKDAGKILKQEELNTAALTPHFVKDGEEASFISSIESLCQTLSLTCSVSSLNESGASADSIKIFHLSVSSQGRYEKVMDLLEEFERSHYPIMIIKADFTSSGREAVASSTVSRWHGIFDIDVPVLVSAN